MATKKTPKTTKAPMKLKPTKAGAMERKAFGRGGQKRGRRGS